MRIDAKIAEVTRAREAARARVGAGRVTGLGTARLRTLARAGPCVWCFARALGPTHIECDRTPSERAVCRHWLGARCQGDRCSHKKKSMYHKGTQRQVMRPDDGSVDDIPDYYAKEDTFFGSKQARLKFIMHAEEVMLHAYSSQMKTHDYTNMTIELHESLQNHVFLEEQFCFSGYHHSVMLLSALAKRLKRGPREHLFMTLQGENGLNRVQSYKGNATNDVVSDTLFRIDAVQKDFGQSHTRRLFSRLKKLFPLVLKYAPPFEEIGQEINRTISPPKGTDYEGCHFGMKSKSLASFESQSRFFDDDMHVRPLVVDDDLVTRWQNKSDGREWKRDYFVFLNVCLNLRRGSRSLQFHVPIRIISFAVRSYSTRWIQPVLVALPRRNAKVYSATWFTITVYFLYSFNSTQLLLSGASCALYLLETLSLRDVDSHLHANMPLQDILGLRTAEDRLSSVQLGMLFDKVKEFGVEERKVFKQGLRLVVNALMASHVMSLDPVHRVNFISPETIEG